MDEILELAGKLGKRVSEDGRAQRLATARAAFERDSAARQLISDYENQQHRIAELEVAGKPIEPDDKRRLADLHQKVVASPILKDLLKAEADYVELMGVISAQIEREALGLPGR